MLADSQQGLDDLTVFKVGHGLVDVAEIDGPLGWEGDQSASSFFCSLVIYIISLLGNAITLFLITDGCIVGNEIVQL